MNKVLFLVYFQSVSLSQKKKTTEPEDFVDRKH